MSPEKQLSSEELYKLARKFHTKKHLGQHFLVNADALKAICSALEPAQEDEILEIGPGIGFLTRLLCKAASKVTAVELDRECTEYLKNLKLENLEIKHGDFLQYQIESGRFQHGESTPDASAFASLGKQKSLKVAGNVPYQITGLIIARLLGEIDQPAKHLRSIKKIVLTVQKEVAERIVAVPKNKRYGQLTLLTGFFCKAELVKVLPAADFYPPPRVDSAIVSLEPFGRPAVEVISPKLLRRIIKTGFSQRRKMLRNALPAAGFQQETLNKVFQELSYDPQVRAESLSLSEFAILADALYQESVRSETENDGSKKAKNNI